MPAGFSVRKILLIVGVLGIALIVGVLLYLKWPDFNVAARKIVELETPVVVLSDTKSTAWLTAKVIKSPYEDFGVGYMDLSIENKQYNTSIFTKVAIDLSDKLYNYSAGTIQSGVLSSRTLVRDYKKLSFSELATSIKIGDMIVIGLSLNRPVAIDLCNTSQCTKIANYITFTNDFVQLPTKVISENGRMQIDTLAVATQFELQNLITQ